MEKHTLLFRNASGEAFRREDVAATVEWLMASIGLDPAMFGAHSLRIGGATAAFEDVEQGEFVSEDLEATSLELTAMRHVELDPESDEEEL
jgi:hypothetical protein